MSNSHLTILEGRYTLGFKEYTENSNKKILYQQYKRIVISKRSNSLTYEIFQATQKNYRTILSRYKNSFFSDSIDYIMLHNNILNNGRYPSIKVSKNNPIIIFRDWSFLEFRQKFE